MTEIKSLSEYNSRLEFFREQGWRSYPDCGKVVTYWCKKTQGQEYEVSGKVMKPPEVNFDKEVKLSYVIQRLKEGLYTKKGELRKKYIDFPNYMSYSIESLMLEANRAFLEKEETILLSWQELKLLKEL